MKKVFLRFIPLLFVIAVQIGFTSCSADVDVNSKPTVKEFDVTAVPGSSSVKLSWKPVDGCSWYQIYVAKSGEGYKDATPYQDLTSTTISYTITNLETKTSYDIKIDGTDYAVGGKRLASQTKTVITLP